MKAEAVVFTGKEKVEWSEVDVPDPGPDDVVVETKFSWISNGTEGSFLRQERSDGVTPWEPGHPLPFPMVAGYQKVGTVVSTGKNVHGFRKGQWVFATITKLNNVHLGFGGHVRVGPSDVNEVYALPEGADPVRFSGLVLTQVGYNTGVRPPVEGKTSAVVVGDGMVGQWAAQTLQMRGANVCLVGRHDLRMNMFDQRCGDLKLKSQDADWIAKAKDWARGEFDIVVDTVGNDTNLEINLKLIPMLRYGGHYVTAGHEGNKSVMDLKVFIYREATVHLPCGWTRPRMEKTLQLVHEGKLKTLPLVTHRLPAREAAKGWENILHHRDKTLGVILEW